MPLLRRPSPCDLEKVVGSPACNVRLTPPGRGVKLEESILEVLVDLHNRCLVSAAVAVVRRTENGNNVLLVAPIVSFHDELVRARNQREAVVVVERLRNILAERVTCATRGNAPAAAVVWVGPEQVAHGAFVGHLLHARKFHDVVQRVNRRRQTTVEAENLCRYWGGTDGIVSQDRLA